MIIHLVLLQPKADLSAPDRDALLDAVRHAITTIPDIRRAHVGRRRIMGRPYDALVTRHFEYALVLEFNDEAALRRYLDHPAHEELGRRFYLSSDAALALDFEMVEAARVRDLIG